MRARLTGDGVRRTLKSGLARLEATTPARGVTLLVYHRIGGGTGDELDVSVNAFRTQLDQLAHHGVASLDDALDALEAGDDTPRFVLTFDDGFEELHRHAWPELRRRGWPFTLYLTTSSVGGHLRWEGARSEHPGRALDWAHVAEMVSSGLCTVGNHTHHHVPPDRLVASELDACTDLVRDRLGVATRHFAYPWGVRSDMGEHLVRARFRSAATGEVGRNRPGADPHRLRRVPVRRTDPPEFFAAKLAGQLRAERCYTRVVETAKRLHLDQRPR